MDPIKIYFLGLLLSSFLNGAPLKMIFDKSPPVANISFAFFIFFTSEENAPN
jgi:hypothetical protein